MLGRLWPVSSCVKMSLKLDKENLQIRKLEISPPKLLGIITAVKLFLLLYIKYLFGRSLHYLILCEMWRCCISEAEATNERIDKELQKEKKMLDREGRFLLLLLGTNIITALDFLSKVAQIADLS